MSKFVRSSGVECYRVLLMLLIVVFHSWKHGIYGTDPGMMHCDAWWTVLLQAMIIWHVDGFVAISGWFGIQLTLRRFLAVYWPILFYSIVALGVGYLTGDVSGIERNRLITGGWFGGAYLMLMLFSPLLNAGVDSLYATGKRNLLLGWLPLALGMFCMVMPQQLFTGVYAMGVYSTSFFLLVFVYVTARVARCLIDRPVGLKMLGLMAVLYFVGVLALGGALAGLHLLRNKPISASLFNVYSDYALPHVWIMAIVMLMIFLWYVKLPDALGRVLVFLGPSMFGVYLLHDVVPQGKMLYLYPERWMQTHGLHPLLTILFSAVFAFVACVGIDLFRRALFLGVKSLVQCYAKKSEA